MKIKEMIFRMVKCIKLLSADEIYTSGAVVLDNGDPAIFVCSIVSVSLKQLNEAAVMQAQEVIQ